MDELVSIKADLPFQVNQIICLEHQYTCLYGEVIQLIPQRGLCWFRPLFMAIGQSSRRSAIANSQSDDLCLDPELINLQSGSDLLWPISLFRNSLDTEVIPFLTQLNDSNKQLAHKSVNHQRLHQFVQKVWQANKDKF